MKKLQQDKIFALGLFISIVSISVAFLKINHWYYPAVIGVWLMFDRISALKNKNTTLSFLLKRDWKTFLKIYFALLILGILIEGIGNIMLKLWYYPYLNWLTFIIFIPLFYSFILISFREMYESLRIKLEPKLAFVSAMILGVIIWEIPNVVSTDWIYTIPYVSAEIVGVNILVILGWSILIGAPLIVYDKILKI